MSFRVKNMKEEREKIRKCERKSERKSREDYR
jgi:hypothetical protein